MGGGVLDQLLVRTRRHKSEPESRRSYCPPCGRGRPTGCPESTSESAACPRPSQSRSSGSFSRCRRATIFSDASGIEVWDDSVLLNADAVFAALTQLSRWGAENWLVVLAERLKSNTASGHVIDRNTQW